MTWVTDTDDTWSSCCETTALRGTWDVAGGEPTDFFADGSSQGLSRVLLAALEQTRASTCITTAQLERPGPTIVYVNPAYCQMTGRRREDVIGATPRIMQGPLTDRRELDRLRSDLDEGEPFQGETVNYRADRTPFIINWRIDPVRDSRGVTTHFVATQEDVTEIRRVERLLEAEQRLDDALTTALTSGREPGSARQLIVDAVREGASLVAAAGTVAVAVTIEHEGYTSGSDAESSEPPVMVSFDQSESDVHGAIHVQGLSADQRSFLDTARLQRYSERASTVVGALVEYQRQRSTALRLQQGLLPTDVGDVPGYAIAARYKPGARGLEIGGDWYDVMYDDRRMIVTVGDVSGHGVDAAAMMGRLRLLAQVEFRRGAEVMDVFTLLDQVCRDRTEFATMLGVELRHGEREARVWSAGHLPAVHFGTHEPRLLELDTLPPLGYLGSARAEPVTVHLDDMSGLLLYTDGLIERRGEPIEQSLDRLARSSSAVDTAIDVVDRVMADLGQDSEDDIAVIAVQPSD